MSDWLFGRRVPPLSTRQIRAKAQDLRRHCQLGAIQRFPALWFAEHVMTELVDHYDFEVVEQLGEHEALAYPDGNHQNPNGPLIQVSQRCYEAACEGDGRARLTVLHECGHVLLHAGLSSRLSEDEPDALKAFENSEWQANQFAAELLMPMDSFRRPRGLKDYTAIMGVSYEAARVRVRQLSRQHGIELPDWAQSGPTEYRPQPLGGDQ